MSCSVVKRSDIWTSKSGANMWCFVHFDLEMCFAPQRRALFQHPNLKKWREHVVFCTFWLGNVLRATTACTFSTSQLPKVVRTWCVLHILTSKCASRHNGVLFFNISTSKSGPTMVCFVHFDFEMCFAPQRRALFRHRNFQKWSDNGVFCTFWLGNVLRATTACTFSTSQLPKVVRPWCVLYILTSKCALRHNGVQLFISHLASWLRTRRFSEPTFRPSGAPNHWKNTVFRDFPTFSRISIFFLLTLSLLLFFLLIFLFSLPLPCSAFHLSILSEVWLLNFLRSYCATIYCYIMLYTVIIYDCRPKISTIRDLWHEDCNHHGQTTMFYNQLAQDGTVCPLPMSNSPWFYDYIRSEYDSILEIEVRKTPNVYKVPWSKHEKPCLLWRYWVGLGCAVEYFHVCLRCGQIF